MGERFTPRPTAEEDLEHLAKLGKKALEKKDKPPEETPPQEKYKLGKAFELKPEVESTLLPEEENPPIQESEETPPPKKYKLGKAFDKKK